MYVSFKVFVHNKWQFIIHILLHILNLVHLLDRVSPSSRSIVETMQWKVTRALCLLLSKTHARPGIVLGHCVRALTQERTISQDVRIEAQRVSMDWSDTGVTVPQLLYEFWDWKEKENINNIFKNVLYFLKKDTLYSYSLWPLKSEFLDLVYNVYVQEKKLALTSILETIQGLYRHYAELLDLVFKVNIYFIQCFPLPYCQVFV